MTRVMLGVSAALATGMGIVGAIVTYEDGAVATGLLLVVAVLGSISIHGVLSPGSYGDPGFDGGFYRVWSLLVPVAAIVAIVVAGSSSGTGARIAYWAGLTAVALLAGALVAHRSTRATASDRRP